MRAGLQKYRVWIALLLLNGFLLSGCTGSATPALSKASTLPAPVPTRTLVLPERTTPLQPPPASYSEVQASYQSMEAKLFERGSQVSDLMAKGDVAGLYSLFDAQMRSQFTLEGLQARLAKLTKGASIGPRQDFRSYSVGGADLYMALHRQGESWWEITAAFDADGQVSSLNLLPLPAADPLSDQGCDGQTAYRLPFDGLWYVVWGGEGELDNYHSVDPAERYAYDFLVWKDGSTFNGDGTRNEDYYAFGQPVLAPADGIVVMAEDGLPDGIPQHIVDTSQTYGNFLLIKTAEKNYLLVAHLKQGSLEVGKDQTVKAGQVLASAGNSGHSSEPHIHIQLQTTDNLDSGRATGVPLCFNHYLGNGQPIDKGMPKGGTFVQDAQ